MKPQTIFFILGNSCSGKSTLTKEIVKQNPQFNAFDDYSVLHEIFEFDEYMRHFMLSNDYTIKDILTELDKFKSRTIYLNEKIAGLINTFKHSDSKPQSIALGTIRNSDGSHKILNLNLWHEILSILFSKVLVSASPSLVEFARGDQDEYLNYFDIQPGESYRYHLNRLVNEGVNLEQSKIIYIKSELESRIHRSIKRKEKGGHFISPKAMKDIYESDSFLEKLINHNGKNSLTIKSKAIPVYVIDNSSDLSDDKLVQKLSVEASKAIEYFDKID